MQDIELTLRLFMNHKQACQAIGRAGSNIKSLRDETGCKITITSKDHSNRVMTVHSKKSVVMKAIQRLAEILESEMNSYGASTRLVPISITLILPKNLGGMIIGKKGEMLKDLRVKSGAQIVMSADTLPKSDERTCRLTGSNFAVVAAVDLIVEIIIKQAIEEGEGKWKGTPSSEIRPYDPKNDEKNGKERDEKDEKIINLATAFLTASQMINPNMEYKPIEVSDQCQELRVPTKHIGAVMGRGGKRINEVRMTSGCRIKIERDDGSGVRRITLTGDQQKIIMATYLINQTISSFSTADKSETKVEDNTTHVENMNSLHSGVTSTEEQAAAAMSAFFANQFGGGGFTGAEFIPNVQTDTQNSTQEESQESEFSESSQDRRPVPDMYTIPEKKPRLHY